MKLTAEEFEYAVRQRGFLAPKADDREAWERAYAASLVQDFQGMRGYLPSTCKAILDVGSGLGGINTLLNRHYGGRCEVNLLDGADDPPKMTKHAETFNSMRVAKAFLRRGGVAGRINCLAPVPDTRKLDPRPCQVIVSLQSWCFHYPPAAYLDFVRACCVRDTTVIVDVRAGKLDWTAQLLRCFAQLGVIWITPKYARIALVPR